MKTINFNQSYNTSIEIRYSRWRRPWQKGVEKGRKGRVREREREGGGGCS